MNQNKINYGLKNVHYSIGTETSNGVYTWAVPKPLLGAVKLERESKSESTVINADDSEYYIFNLTSGDTLNLSIMKFTDEFKKDVMGYKVGSNGELIEIKGKPAKPIALLFEEQGDKHIVKYEMFNCIPGSIKKSFETLEKGKPKVEAETMQLTFIGISLNGEQIGMVEVVPENTNFADLYTKAPTIQIAPGV